MDALIACRLIPLDENPGIRPFINSSDGNIQITSEEGTTQGCNLAMILYTLGLTPVVRMLSDLISKVEERVRQCWLADDASAIESLMGIQAWWDRLV